MKNTRLQKQVLFLLLLCSTYGYAQPVLKPNDFRIGMFGFVWDGANTNLACSFLDSVPLIVCSGHNYPSSTLNVIDSDGFNTVIDYNAFSSYGPNIVKKAIMLVHRNGMMAIPDVKDFYQPTFINRKNPTCVGLNQDSIWNPGGINVYTGGRSNYILDGGDCYTSSCRDFLDTLFEEVYSQSPYSSYIWGYHTAEEPEWNHYCTFNNSCGGYGNWAFGADVEIPPSNLSAAIGHYRNILSSFGVSGQKMELMPANHGQTVNQWTRTHSYSGCLPTCGYNQEDYINPSNMPNMPDAYFDGAYYQFPENYNDWYWWYFNPYSILKPTTWSCNSSHYLGKFKSLDYALTKVSAVQADNNVSNFPVLIGVGGKYDSSWYNSRLHNGNIYCYHSDPVNHPNANYLWFLNYTSVIHGASGVWCWDFLDEYVPKDIPGDSLNYLYLTSNESLKCDRFSRKYFPYLYTTFVSNLAKELRYLVNANLLSTDTNTLVYKKTDQADPNCIVPAASTYITNALLASNSIPTNSPIDGHSVYSDLESENYGLRYTIRTNGSRTIMIITNPLPIAIDSVPLNFSNLANPVIRNADSIKVLFEGSYPTNSVVASSTYKNNRNSNINLVNNTVGTYVKQILPSNKKLSMSFGPMDTHVIEFIDPIGSPPSFSNGWTKVWSNNGSGGIGGVQLQSVDQFLVGNFLGMSDGSQQLLVIQKDGSGHSWATILQYEVFPNANSAGEWEWKWSNYGNDKLGGWSISASDQYIVGAFKSGIGGKDLLLCANTANGWASVIDFYSGTWNDDWDNGGNGKIGTSTSYWGMSAGDKFISGNWLGLTGGQKELLCVQNRTGAVADILTFSSGLWTISSSNGGSGIFGTTWTINPADRYVEGNYKATGDELLCSNTGGTHAAILHYSSGWSYQWNNGGSGGIGGMGIPASTDFVFTGNLDNASDGEDDIMLVQGSNTSGANWATTVDLNSSSVPTWEWSNHNGTCGGGCGYINDWPVVDANGSAATYFLIHPVHNDLPYLMALRSYTNNGCSASYLASMYKTNCSSCGYGPVSPQSKADSNSFGKSMKVYPNPNKGEYTVAISNGSDENATIEIYSILGQMVKSIPNQKLSANTDNLIQINMLDVPEGQYIIRCVTNSSVMVDRVVISK